MLTVVARESVAGYERTLPASIQARHESPLGFRVAGRILTRRVELGDTVAAGALLGALDPSDYALGARVAEGQRRAAEIELAQAERDAARFARLGAEGALGTAEEERQRARAEAAAARLDVARQQLALAGNREDYTQLRAPFAGVVTQLQFEPGLSVSEGQTVLTLADPAELEVVADIPLELQGRLAGLRARATPPDAPDTGVALRLREVSPQANPNARTVRARFSLPPPGRRAPARATEFGLGRAVDLHLTEAPQTAATDAGSVVLPAAALVQTAGAPFVYRVDERSRVLARLPVTVIGYAADAVRVRGIPAGARIVAAGAQKLHEGLIVAVLERSASGLDLPGSRR